MLAGLAAQLDAVGRWHPETDSPSIDAHTLRTALTSLADSSEAHYLISVLEDLPGRAFRENSFLRPPPQEVSWFTLAEHVEVYDTDGTAFLTDLRSKRVPTQKELAAAVEERFPSLELEMLEANALPAVLANLTRDETATWLKAVTRQSGWWAALIGTIMRALAIYVRRTPRADIAWPLCMFMLSAAVGGWTLTVVGSCALARYD